MSDVLTPVMVESWLRRLVTALSRAEHDLEVARNAEVDAKHTADSARRRALLGDECPKVTRGGVTTAERDAWVDQECEQEQHAADFAEATRKAAEDHLRVVRDQGSIVQTMARSVQQAFAMAGAS